MIEKGGRGTWEYGPGKHSQSQSDLFAWSKIIMMRQIKFGLGMAMVAVATLVCAAHIWRSAGLPRSVTLADRSVLTVESISIANSNYYHEAFPKAWQLALGKWLPYAVAAGLGWRYNTKDEWAAVGSASGMTNLVIFTKREGPGREPSDQIRVGVLDNHGNTLGWYEGGRDSTMQDARSAHYHQMRTWIIGAFPRRGKTLTVRFWRKEGDGKPDVPILQFEIANPQPGPYPIWTPEPWPATKHAGDLAVTLTDFTTGLSASDPTRAAVQNEEVVTQLAFDLEVKGRTNCPWRVKNVAGSDATGSDWFSVPSANKTQAHQKGVTETWNSPVSLWPGESAWKLRVELAAAPGTAPEGLATITGIEVPAEGSSLPLRLTTNLAGFALRMQKIETKKAAAKARGVTVPVTVSYAVEAMPQECHLSVVKVSDDRGRPIQVNWRGASSAGAYYLDLTVPVDAAQLSCTFELRRSRFVEFLARPRILSSKHESP
jgi:hypothetical protein